MGALIYAIAYLGGAAIPSFRRACKVLLGIKTKCSRGRQVMPTAALLYEDQGAICEDQGAIRY
jgi:hypothetical protein